MANGSKKIDWTPADEEQEAKAEAGEPYQGKDGNWYQHPAFAEASRKNPPVAATPEPAKSAAEPPAASQPPEASGNLPSAADLDKVAEEQKAKNATAAATSVQMAQPPAVKTPNLGYDADKLDSTGRNKKDGSKIGPRGKDKPADVMTEAERSAAVKQDEAKRNVGAASTHSVDSVGKPKGSFEVVSQGVDKHGAKIPDKVDYSKPTEKFVPMHGPRGAGAPKDTFHKA